MKELKVTADDKNMDTINDFIHSVMPEECSPGIIYKIDLAVEEIFVNIAHYAYNVDDGKVEIESSFANNLLKVVFKDQGKKFNPLEKKDPDINLAAEDRKIGGLGIFLTKKFMDSVEYRYADNQNILTICRKI